MPAGALRRGPLYLVFAALLLVSVWNGGYFPYSKWVFVFVAVAAGLRQLLLAAVSGEAVAGSRRPALPRSPALWLLVAFTLVAAAGLAWSVSPADTARETALLSAYVSVLFVISAQRAAAPRETMETALRWLAYVAAFVSAWGVVTYVLRTPPYVLLLDGLYRAGSTFEYSNALACFALMSLPPSLALLAAAPRRDRPLYVLAATLETAAVLLSFSRLGLVLLVLVYAWEFFTRRRQVAQQLTLSRAASLVLAAAAVAAGDASLPGVVGVTATAAAAYLVAGRLPLRRGWPFHVAAAATAALLLAAALASGRLRLALQTRVVEGFSPEKLLPHRLDTYRGALDTLADHPLLGSGLGTFARVYRDHALVSYTKFAHDLPLQVAVDTGLAGAALIVVFLLYIAVRAVAALAGSGWRRAAAVSVLVFIVYNLVDWEWYVPALTAWFMVMTACLEGGGRRQAGSEVEIDGEKEQVDDADDTVHGEEGSIDP